MQIVLVSISIDDANEFCQFKFRIELIARVYYKLCAAFYELRRRLSHARTK